jgi:hypothetical protein
MLDLFVRIDAKKILETEHDIFPPDSQEN